MSSLRSLLRDARERFRKARFEADFTRLRSKFSRKEDEFVRSLPSDLPFGCLVYPTTNVGDEMQSIAQMGFLPTGRRVVAVDREFMNAYRGPEVRMIANGWYVHRQHSWPPSPRINPIFVSFHLASHWTPDAASLQYLRDNGPIGCRDLATVRRLEAYDVEAYFSGCLTLTLENPHIPDIRKGVVICDADLGYDGGYPPSATSIVHRLVPREIREGAELIRQECSSRLQVNYPRKFNIARAMLEKFARASLVITTRLHCALPCRALGTPVVFIHQDYHQDPRFEGLREVLQGYGPDAKSIDIDWFAPKPVDISDFRERVTNATLSAMATKWMSTRA